jgi:hypothetical protein
MKIAMVLANLVEDRETIMTRFLNELNHEIVNIIEL